MVCRNMVWYCTVWYSMDNTVWIGMVQGVEKEGQPSKEESPKMFGQKAKRTKEGWRVGCKTLWIIHQGKKGDNDETTYNFKILPEKANTKDRKR